jgi:putative flippase GtrA
MTRKLASLFVGETSNPLVQLFRYALVGGLAFVVDFGALAILWKFAGVHYLWAAAFAFVLGLVTNYIISVAWVFDKRSQKNWQVEFAIFALLGVLGLGINELSMFVLTGLAGLHPLASKIVSTAVTFLWNFISRKALLFSFAAKEPKAVVAPVAMDAPTPASWNAETAALATGVASIAADVRPAG